MKQSMWLITLLAELRKRGMGLWGGGFTPRPSDIENKSV